MLVTDLTIRKTCVLRIVPQCTFRIAPRERLGKQFLFFENIFGNFAHFTATSWCGSASAEPTKIYKLHNRL